MQALTTLMPMLFAEGRMPVSERYKNIHVTSPAPFPVVDEADQRVNPGAVMDDAAETDFMAERIRIPLVKTNLPLILFKKRGDHIHSGDVADVFVFVRDKLLPYNVNGGVGMAPMSQFTMGEMLEDFVNTIAVEFVECEDVPTPFPPSMLCKLKEECGEPKDDYMCTICQERLDGDIDVDEQTFWHLPCTHAFHRACLEDYFQTRRICPTCRDETVTSLRCSKVLEDLRVQVEGERGGSTSSSNGSGRDDVGDVDKESENGGSSGSSVGSSSDDESVAFDLNNLSDEEEQSSGLGLGGGEGGIGEMGPIDARGRSNSNGSSRSSSSSSSRRNRYFRSRIHRHRGPTFREQVANLWGPDLIGGSQSSEGSEGNDGGGGADGGSADGDVGEVGSNDTRSGSPSNTSTTSTTSIAVESTIDTDHHNDSDGAPRWITHDSPLQFRFLVLGHHPVGENGDGDGGGGDGGGGDGGGGDDDSDDGEASSLSIE